MFPMTSVSRHIRAARRLLKWRQADLASKTGLSHSAISNYETGKREIPLGALRTIADAFDITPGQLVRGELSVLQS